MYLKKIVPQQKRDVAINAPRIYNLEANVILGSPSSGCEGIGICKALPKSFNSPFPCPTYHTGLTCLHAEKKLVFKLNINVLDDFAWKTHFSNQHFCVAETFTMPPKVCSTFGIKSMQIIPGNYTICQFDDFMQFEVDWE